MNSTVEDDEMYAWLTEELGWTPQEAYQELTQAKEEPDYRAPEGPQEQPDAIRGTLQANEAMKAEEASLRAAVYKAGSQDREPECTQDAITVRSHRPAMASCTSAHRHRQRAQRVVGMTA